MTYLVFFSEHETNKAHIPRSINLVMSSLFIGSSIICSPQRYTNYLEYTYFLEKNKDLSSYSYFYRLLLAFEGLHLQTQFAWHDGIEEDTDDGSDGEA